jgi:hypothetical protein
VPASPHFRSELVKFLTDLRANDNREWFQAKQKALRKSRARPPRFIPLPFQGLSRGTLPSLP